MQWLLGNDAVRGRDEAHVVHLDEGLAVQAQPVEQGLEVQRQRAQPREAVDEPPDRAEVDVDLIDQPRLQAVDAGVVGARDGEAGVPERRLEARGRRRPDGADQRLHPPHQRRVRRVRRVVRRQADPVDEQELRARLQYPVDLLEQRRRVLAEAEGLYFVECVEGFVGEWQG